METKTLYWPRLGLVDFVGSEAGGRGLFSVPVLWVLKSSWLGLLWVSFGSVGFVPAVCRRERDLPADLQKLLSVKRIFHVPQCGDLKLIFMHTHFTWIQVQIGLGESNA